MVNPAFAEFACIENLTSEDSLIHTSPDFRLQLALILDGPRHPPDTFSCHRRRPTHQRLMEAQSFLLEGSTADTEMSWVTYCITSLSVVLIWSMLSPSLTSHVASRLRLCRSSSSLFVSPRPEASSPYALLRWTSSITLTPRTLPIRRLACRSIRSFVLTHAGGTVMLETKIIQTVVATSSTEAEIMVAATAVTTTARSYAPNGPTMLDEYQGSKTVASAILLYLLQVVPPPE